MNPFFLSLILTAPPALDSTEVLEPVRVHGEYRPPPAPVLTLSRTWITERHPVDMREALASVSGLRLIQLGTGDAMPAIRGLGPNRVAVLVDGRPLNTAQGGGVDLNTWDPESLERIEIARGAVGALYGPYALGGAVNLVRRKGTTGARSLRLLGGEGAVRARGTMDGGTRNIEWHAGGEAYRFPEGSAHSWSRSAWFDSRKILESGATLDGTLSFSGDHRAVPGSRNFPSPRAARRDDRLSLSFAAEGMHLPAGTWDSDLSFHRLRRHYRDPGAPLGPIEDTHVNETTRWTNTLEISPSLICSGEFLVHRLQSTTDGDRNRLQGALASQVARKHGAFRFSGTGRVDWWESLAPGLSARAHGEFTLGSGLRLRFGGGTASRAPSFDDLFWPARASAAGNPNLASERAYDLDVGFLLQYQETQVDVTAYAMTVTDWIQWTPGVDGIWRPHNTDHVQMTGVEASANLTLPGFLPRLDLSYTGSASSDETQDPFTTGKALVGRPQQRFFWEGRWNLAMTAFGLGSRTVSAIPLTASNTKWQPPYTLFHAFIHFRLTPALLLEAEGKNLSDTLYEDVRGYATRGREISLGVTWRRGAS